MSAPDYTTWLQSFLSGHGGVAGTVHLRGESVLEQAAAVNIPPPVQAKTARIAKGKGMAGLAWERGAPVQTCNLKTDTTGDVRPGAKAVKASAAVALPVKDGHTVRAIVGIAFMGEREISADELATLQAAADRLP